MMGANDEGGAKVLDGAVKDTQSVDKNWRPNNQLIDGVRIREVKNIVTGNGMTTEIFRQEWPEFAEPVRHILYVTFRPGVVSAWHCHEQHFDALFVVQGSIQAAVYDDRENSATRGMVNHFNLSRGRPTLVVLPPLVWHGFKNLEQSESAFIGFFDEAYDYENPDERRVPPDHPDIPYSFD